MHPAKKIKIYFITSKSKLTRNYVSWSMISLNDRPGVIVTTTIARILGNSESVPGAQHLN